jgi:hypothetical protein
VEVGLLLKIRQSVDLNSRKNEDENRATAIVLGIYKVKQYLETVTDDAYNGTESHTENEFTQYIKDVQNMFIFHVGGSKYVPL